MKYDIYLMEILKDQYEDYLIDKFDYSDDQIEALYEDENGDYFETNEDFIRAYRKDILSKEVIKYVYDFITKVSIMDDLFKKQVISLLFIHFYTMYYFDESKKEMATKIAKFGVEAIVATFFQEEKFGIEMLLSYYHDAIEQEEYEMRLEKLYEEEKPCDLDAFFEVSFPQRIFTINEKLREIVCNLYNHYIYLGCPDEEALRLTWMYFFNDVDPLNELDELGIEDEQKEYYKRYMLRLIIGDLYEDAINKPLVNTDNKKGKIAQTLPLIYTITGKIEIPQDEEIRNRMLKYFILLQDDGEKIKSNRQNTYAQKKDSVLRTINPCYKLDELQFKK